MEKIFKHYVGVITYTNMEGRMRPLYIVWNEGLKYKIDLIYKVGPHASLAGGGGILYECKIDHKRIKLFKEKERWFIETNHAPMDYWCET